MTRSSLRTKPIHAVTVQVNPKYVSWENQAPLSANVGTDFGQIRPLASSSDVAWFRMGRAPAFPSGVSLPAKNGLIIVRTYSSAYQGVEGALVEEWDGTGAGTAAPAGSPSTDHDAHIASV